MCSAALLEKLDEHTQARAGPGSASHGTWGAAQPCRPAPEEWQAPRLRPRAAWGLSEARVTGTARDLAEPVNRGPVLRAADKTLSAGGGRPDGRWCVLTCNRPCLYPTTGADSSASGLPERHPGDAWSAHHSDPCLIRLVSEDILGNDGSRHPQHDCFVALLRSLTLHLRERAGGGATARALRSGRSQAPRGFGVSSDTHRCRAVGRPPDRAAGPRSSETLPRPFLPTTSWDLRRRALRVGHWTDWLVDLEFFFVLCTEKYVS